MNERILLADDSSFMRKIQRGALEKQGYEICGEAETGSEAIERYEELLPDLMVLGLIFPQTDGIEILRQIKKEYPDAKIIICSSLSQEGYVASAFRHGASNFIAKPFQPEFLAEIAKSSLESTKLSSLLSPDILTEWCAKQTVYRPDAKLTQDQINIMANSYYELYSRAPAAAPPPAESREELLKKLGELSGAELEELLKNANK